MRPILFLCVLVLTGCQSEQAIKTYQAGRQAEFSKVIDKKIVSITEETSAINLEAIRSTVITMDDGTIIEITSHKHFYDFQIRGQ